MKTHFHPALITLPALLILAGSAHAQGGTISPPPDPPPAPEAPAAAPGGEGEGEGEGASFWDKLKKGGGEALTAAGEKVSDQVKGLSEGVSENLSALKELKNEVAELRLLTRGSQQASSDEIAVNRRARSARLRAAEKVDGGAAA